MSVASSLVEFQIPLLGVKDAYDFATDNAVAEHEIISRLEGEQSNYSYWSAGKLLSWGGGEGRIGTCGIVIVG